MCRRLGPPVAPAISDTCSMSAIPRQIDPRGLELRVAVEGVERLVAPEPRLLRTAERDRVVGTVEGVDPDRTSPEPARDPMGPRHVAGPDGRRQPVRRIVRDADRVRLVSDLDDGQDGPEDLLAGDPHLVADVAQDGRLDIEAARLLADPLATQLEPGALLLAQGDVGQDALHLDLVDGRPEARRRVE